MKAGATDIPVESVDGFNAGQTITIGSGENLEKVVVASVTNRRGWWWRPRNNDGPSTFVTLTEPIVKQHKVGEQVSGSGITLATPLAKVHDSGDQVASNIPTPGTPNQF